MRNPKIVVIGGGTGSFAILSDLKNYTDNISALVNMIDDGGSTGHLRDEYGVLPPGDVRQCLVALSQAPQTVRDLFNFRFPGETGLSGHSFGNLFLSAFEMMTDNFSQAVKSAAEVLNIKGNVYPVSLDKCNLALSDDGQETVGETAIANTLIKQGSKPKLYLKPKASLNPEAKEAINDADLIVIAPGDLYTSIIPTLLVDGLKEVINQSSAKVVYIANLVNKAKHTNNFSVDDYIREIERFLGQGSIDIVLYNDDMPSKDLLVKYALEGEYPVVMDREVLKNGPYKAIAGNFLSYKSAKRDSNDIFLERSLIRHDGRATSEAIINCLD